VLNWQLTWCLHVDGLLYFVFWILRHFNRKYKMSKNNCKVCLFIAIVYIGSWQAICAGTTYRKDKFHIWAPDHRGGIWQLERGWFWMGNNSAGNSEPNGMLLWCIAHRNCLWQVFCSAVGGAVPREITLRAVLRRGRQEQWDNWC